VLAEGSPMSVLSPQTNGTLVAPMPVGGSNGTRDSRERTNPRSRRLESAMTYVIAIALAVTTMVLLAVIMVSVLGWAAETYHVEVDPRVEAISAALPGANCGNCGYVGCHEYATAVAQGEAEPDRCTVGGPSVASTLSRMLGVEVRETWPHRAVVHCSANLNDRLGDHEYRGEQTCAAADVTPGVQACVYGCLGLGDCATACEYDAIYVQNGLAVVDYNRCVGCGACARVCPRHIISIIPFKAERMPVVACSNKDFGKDVREVCKTGCIGCKICERLSSLFTMEGNLPTIDYTRYDPARSDVVNALRKCPTKVIQFVGRLAGVRAPASSQKTRACNAA
jgi:RnfABCDGE-type electron transport complex B subunit